MGKFFKQIHEEHKEFISNQHIFFVGTAPIGHDGRVNLSPKGLNSFKVISENEVGYMDLISSGNETSAHILENERVTFMFCSFENKPRILRLYGRGKVVLPECKEWNKYVRQFEIFSSTRQIIIAKIDLIQTSCGFGVPMYEYKGNRKIHFEWAEKKGQEGLEEYKQKNNLKSLDGLNTHLGLKR